MAIKADAASATGQTVSPHLIGRFKSSVDKFAGLADETFFEIASFGDHGESFTKEETISKDQIQGWLDLKTPVPLTAGRKAPSNILRLIVSPFNVDTTDYLPLPRGQLQSMFKFFGLKDSYIHDEKLQSSSNWFSIPLENDLVGFIVKTEVYDSECASFSLALVADRSSGRASGVLHVLLKADLKEIRNHLIEYPQYYSRCLMALPLALAQVRTRNMPDKLEEIRIQLYETEKRLGSHKNYQHKDTHTRWGYYARGEEVWKREGFDAAGGELTSMVADCVMLESKARLYAKLLEWIEEMHRKLSLKNLQQDQFDAVLSEKALFLKGNVEHSRIRSEYLGRRAEAQVQACAGIMSQRDNANSLKASKVALRDSNDMRAISLVTMLFFPGTFMATLFSTGFFSFQQEGRVVSNWFWLYWVFTAGLTAIALGMFALWNHYTVRREVQERKSAG